MLLNFIKVIIHTNQVNMTTLFFAHEYGLWDANDNRNIESLVIEMRTSTE
jgi:hypothetical protein